MAFKELFGGHNTVESPKLFVAFSMCFEKLEICDFLSRA
jgi:hypothetical protein